MAWNFDDFLRRLEAIKGMGSLEDLLDQVPGLGAVLREVDFKLDDLEPIENILRAMTLDERLDPRLLEGESGLERRQRIAERAGTTVEAVESLIWQFNSLMKMLENMSPDEVTQELIQDSTPERETWQVSPDAWKASFEEDESDWLEHEEDSEGESPAALEERLDEILRKIGREGMDALSDAEREFLDASSKRLRDR
ncbi:MAG TPA: hypothetical protein DEA08_08050 [Planctomycetes bacterium]|nr:hypothetical protein [Planctomycetota bacterium]